MYIQCINLFNFLIIRCPIALYSQIRPIYVSRACYNSSTRGQWTITKRIRPTCSEAFANSNRNKIGSKTLKYDRRALFPK